MTRRIVIVLLRLLLPALLCPAAAWGTNTGVGFGSLGGHTGLYLPIGVLLAAEVPLDGRESRLTVGAEVSLVWADLGDSFLWAGGYTDVAVSADPGTLWWSVGGELGWGPAGVDVGYALGTTEDGLRHGVAVRFLGTIGVVAVFARYVAAIGAEDHLLFGVLLKYPLAL